MDKVASSTMDAAKRIVEKCRIDPNDPELLGWVENEILDCIFEQQQGPKRVAAIVRRAAYHVAKHKS